MFGTPQGSIGTALHGTGEVADATPGILGKLGLTKGGGSMKMTPLGMISGASLLTYFMQKGKTEEEGRFSTRRIQKKRFRFRFNQSRY